MQEHNRPFTIAIIEDEPVLREELAFQLRQFGHTVETFASAALFYRHLAVNHVATAILDIGLPDEDGLSICRHLRAHDKQMGIIFVTARSQRQDRLQGLEGGADAYLIKPVDFDELLLTLNRLRDRYREANEPDAWNIEETTGKWQINLDNASLTAPNGATIGVSLNEIQLLRFLQTHAPQPCTPTQLGMAMGLLPEEFDKHRVEVVVSRLRSKVKRISGLNIPIRAHRGLGYSLQ
jgi:DNA-binding response OmpR family regulator